VVADSAADSCRRRREEDRGDVYNNLTTSERRESFELSCSRAAQPRDYCWDFVFS
jgi:hypothetical protein